MSDVLDDAALGDESLILPGAALGETALLGDAGAPPRRPVWSPQLLGIYVSSDQCRATGYAEPGKQTTLGDSDHLEFYCYKPARFVLTVRFHVDAEGVPRPRPIAPPACRLQWQFVPDDGSPAQGETWEDNAPVVPQGVGDPLVTSFGSTLRLKSSSGGRLTVSASLTDRAGLVTYQDTIRCVITPCRDGGIGDV